MQQQTHHKQRSLIHKLLLWTKNYEHYCDLYFRLSVHFINGCSCDNMQLEIHIHIVLLKQNKKYGQKMLNI